jgi:hypothetical protein
MARRNTTTQQQTTTIHQQRVPVRLHHSQLHWTLPYMLFLTVTLNLVQCNGFRPLCFWYHPMHIATTRPNVQSKYSTISGTNFSHWPLSLSISCAPHTSTHNSRHKNSSSAPSTSIAPQWHHLVPKYSFRLHTWAPHGVDGWYLGPAMEHNRWYRVFATETAAERITDTLAWFPSAVKMPTATSSEAMLAAATVIIHALKHPSPASALSPHTDTQYSNVTRNPSQRFLPNKSQPPMNPPTPEPQQPKPIPLQLRHPISTTHATVQHNSLLQH